jgi:putative DNA primase/helicase
MTSSAEIVDLRNHRSKGDTSVEFEIGLGDIRPLGFDGEWYFYFSPVTQQIVRLRAGDHTEANLCRLKPLEYWQKAYPAPPGRKSASFDVATARDALMRACHAEGVLDLERRRGRGIWWDEESGSVVVFDGRWVRQDGRAWLPSDARFHEIYEGAVAWKGLDGEPLGDAEAGELLELGERFDWVEPCYGRLYAGFCVVAPVAAALPWRPHINLTGPKECGKTFTAKAVLGTAGPTVLHLLGESSAAGIRQKLREDSRTILWDEAEGQGDKGARRIQESFALARNYSTAGGGKVLKGSAGHEAVSFGGCAAICLVSIVVQLVRSADESRFTVLELRSRVNRVNTRRDQETVAAMERLTPSYSAGLIARTVRALPVLRRNAQIYAQAIAELFGSTRLGDQVGTLLAGAALLRDCDEISLAEARHEVDGLPAAVFGAVVETSDEERCLYKIASRLIRCDAARERRQVTRTLGELVVLRAKRIEQGVSWREAGRILGRYGIRVLDPRDRHQRDEPMVAIANHHPELEQWLADTDFANGGHGPLLGRLRSAEKLENSLQFGSAKSRGPLIPIDYFLNQPFHAPPTRNAAPEDLDPVPLPTADDQEEDENRTEDRTEED